MTLLHERLTSNLLAGPPAESVLAVCERLLAIQAQDPLGARLAIRARSRGLNVADFERALNDREVLITWLNRGTLHLVPTADYFWLHALTAPRLLNANSARLRQLGVEAEAADRLVDLIVRALDARGPLSRYELAPLVQPRDALVHVLFRASLRGRIVRGPVGAGAQAGRGRPGKQHRYVLVEDWLGSPPRPDRDAALHELGRRFLQGHAPADERDLAKWAGIPLGEARLALRDVKPPAVRAAELPPPRLLGSFDAILFGWTSREPFTGSHERDLVAGGMFLPAMMAGGRAVGSWRMPAGRLVLAPFADLSPADADAFAADFVAVQRFLGAN
jgi:hypothetical protein